MKKYYIVIVIALILIDIGAIFIGIAGIKTAIKLEKAINEINDIKFEIQYKDYALQDSLNQ